MAKKTNNENTQFRKSKIEQLFNLVKDKEGKINIIVGQYKVTNKTFETFEEAETYIGTKPYDLIFNTSSLITKMAIENEKVSYESPKDN